MERKTLAATFSGDLDNFGCWVQKKQPSHEHELERVVRELEQAKGQIRTLEKAEEYNNMQISGLRDQLKGNAPSNAGPAAGTSGSGEYESKRLSLESDWEPLVWDRAGRPLHHRHPGGDIIGGILVHNRCNTVPFRKKRNTTIRPPHGRDDIGRQDKGLQRNTDATSGRN